MWAQYQNVKTKEQSGSDGCIVSLEADFQVNIFQQKFYGYCALNWRDTCWLNSINMRWPSFQYHIATFFNVCNEQYGTRAEDVVITYHSLWHFLPSHCSTVIGSLPEVQIDLFKFLSYSMNLVPSNFHIFT